MGAITVRNLPPDLARAIRQKAKRERTSLNRTVISLLEEANPGGQVWNNAETDAEKAPYGKFQGWTVFEAAEAYASVGEISDRLRGIFGEYRETAA